MNLNGIQNTSYQRFYQSADSGNSDCFQFLYFKPYEKLNRNVGIMLYKGYFAEPRNGHEAKDNEKTGLNLGTHHLTPEINSVMKQ